MKRKSIGYRTAYSKEIGKAVKQFNKLGAGFVVYSQNDFVEYCVEKMLVSTGFLK
jgi:hypothetical protein